MPLLSEIHGISDQNLLWLGWAVGIPVGAVIWEGLLFIVGKIKKYQCRHK